MRARDPVLDELSPATRAQLATLLPGLRDDAVADPRSGTDGVGQLRLFEALLELIDRLGTRAPVVLILEDIHWADRSTRAFIAFLTRSLRAERALLLVTYRTDELHRRHPLRPLLSELERAERARRIELEPFDRSELRQALADILGAEPDSPLVERLFARSEGNPLYTEELLAAGLDGRGAPPRSLSDAFFARIERLTPDAQRIARVLALGRALDEGALAALTGLEREPVLAALREAVAEQVLVPDAEGRLCFRHAQRARDLGDAAMRRDALARARIHLSRIEAAAQGGGPIERARLAQGKAEMARARGRAGARDWARAAAAWEAIRHPYPAAIARWREAECHVAHGDRVAATVAARAAVSAAHELGSVWLAREARGLADRARLSLDGAAPAPATPEAAAPEDPFGLTARERQVLALLARGATNRQIGASLYMAEKTASVHVSRILAKLDVQRRTEAAAVAHRMHLV